MGGTARAIENSKKVTRQGQVAASLCYAAEKGIFSSSSFCGDEIRVTIKWELEFITIFRNES